MLARNGFIDYQKIELATAFSVEIVCATFLPLRKFQKVNGQSTSGTEPTNGVMGKLLGNQVMAQRNRNGFGARFAMQFS